MAELTLTTFLTLDGVMQAMMKMKKIDIAALQRAREPA